MQCQSKQLYLDALNSEEQSTFRTIFICKPKCLWARIPMLSVLALDLATTTWQVPPPTRSWSRSWSMCIRVYSCHITYMWSMFINEYSCKMSCNSKVCPHSEDFPTQTLLYSYYSPQKPSEKDLHRCHVVCELFAFCWGCLCYQATQGFRSWHSTCHFSQVLRHHPAYLPITMFQ